MNRFVAISGNIGVGKTTVTDLVAKKLKWRAFFEPVIDNPYLDDFYADMNRWSFHLQVYFLSKRFESQVRISKSEVSCIQDRSIYEDVEIFARILHLQGSIDARDYENYTSLFRQMTQFLRNPDLIVYLRADVDVLLERIAQRGRESEKTIDPEYLRKLNEAYEGWAERATRYCPVYIIETNDLKPDETGGVSDLIAEEISQRFGLISLPDEN